MMVYDASRLQKIIINNNGQYESDINKKIEIFKQALISEIVEIFQYYGVYASPASIEQMMDDIIPSIKNDLRYKKIMIIISDAIGELRFNKQNSDQILDDAFERQNNANKRMDVMQSFMELSRLFNRLDINQTAIEEVLFTIKRKLMFLQNEVGELTDDYIKVNKNNITSIGQELDTNVNLQEQNITGVQTRCQMAINELDEDKAIAFLQNEFSMLNNDEIDSLVTTLVSQIPFGTQKLEQFLKEKQIENKNNRGLTNLDKLNALLK